MAEVPSFSLFNLPLVAIYKVLKETMPLDLLQLLSVSKKTKVIVKTFLKRNSSKMNYKLHVGILAPYDNLELDLWHGDNKKLRISFNTLDQYHLYEQLMILQNFDNVNVLVNVNYDYNVFNALCDDVKTNSKNMLHYLCKLFTPILSVESFGNQSLTSEVLGVMKDENAKFDELSFFSFCTGHFYQKLLELPIRKLYLSPHPTNFQYKSPSEPMKFEEIQINEARWVTSLEDFLHCKSVILRNTNLNNQDMKRFLRKWMESDCQLEYLDVQMLMNQLNLKEIVEGLSAVPLNRVYMENRLEYFKDGKCFSFQRSNGGKGIIYQDGIYIILLIESDGRS